MTAIDYRIEPLETDRLLLRPLTADDLEAVLVYQTDAEVLRYMLWPTRTRAEAVEHLERRSRMTHVARDGDGLIYGVAEKERPDRVVGEINLQVTSVIGRQAEVGWILNPQFHGRGYAVEAATRVIDLAVETLGIHRVHAQLDPRNDASVALCARLGMRLEAHFVEDIFYKGEWGDTGVYAVLAREWRERRHAAGA